MNFDTPQNPVFAGSKVQEMVNNLMNTKATNMTISDKISALFVAFYYSYIYEHRYFVIFLIVAILFLIYRYYEKQNSEKFSSSDINKLSNLIQDQVDNLKYDEQPTLNPTKPVILQEEPVDYPPQKLPINIPGQGIQLRSELYPYPKSDVPLNYPKDYDYNNVYTDKSRSYYTGTYNPYENTLDTTIENPYGFSNAFNTTTNNYVGGMTAMNNDALRNYQTFIDNVDGNLINSLKWGPTHLDLSSPDMRMQPPYEH